MNFLQQATGSSTQLQASKRPLFYDEEPTTSAQQQPSKRPSVHSEAPTAIIQQRPASNRPLFYDEDPSASLQQKTLKRPSFYNAQQLNVKRPAANDQFNGASTISKRPIFYDDAPTASSQQKNSSARPSFYDRAYGVPTQPTIKSRPAFNGKEPGASNHGPFPNHSVDGPRKLPETRQNSSSRPSFYDDANVNRSRSSSYKPPVRTNNFGGESKRSTTKGFGPTLIDVDRARLEKKIRGFGGGTLKTVGDGGRPETSSTKAFGMGERPAKASFGDKREMLAPGQRNRLDFSGGRNASFPNHSIDSSRHQPFPNHSIDGPRIKQEFGQAPPQIDDKLAKKIKGLGGYVKPEKFAIVQPEQRQQVKAQATAPGVRKRTVELSDEQKRVINLTVNKGKSIFFTGDAGTGKSYLLREIIGILRKKLSREQSMF
jgi:hypothetical protein